MRMTLKSNVGEKAIGELEKYAMIHIFSNQRSFNYIFIKREIKLANLSCFNSSLSSDVNFFLMSTLIRILIFIHQFKSIKSQSIILCYALVCFAVSFAACNKLHFSYTSEKMVYVMMSNPENFFHVQFTHLCDTRAAYCIILVLISHC